METWYKVSFPSKEAVLGGRVHQLQDAFEQLYILNAGPRDAAMFSDEDLESYFCYFSPGAVRIARDLIESLGAVPCEAPEKGTVNIIVGRPDVDEIPLSRAG